MNVAYAKSRMILPVLALVLLTVAAGCGKSQSSTPSASDSAASASPASWTEEPKMTIDKAKTYQAVFETSKGSFTVDLFAKDAPITVNNFVFLANQHFYDGVTFHRILETYMIQTGDPTGTGAGGPGYTIEDELNNGHSYEPGILAMANTGDPHTGGSQFFICTGDDSKGLNQPEYAKYSIFGKVSDGMDAVKAIAATPVTTGASGEPSRPTETVTIKSITIKTGS